MVSPPVPRREHRADRGVRLAHPESTSAGGAVSLMSPVYVGSFLLAGSILLLEIAHYAAKSVRQATYVDAVGAEVAG